MNEKTTPLNDDQLNERTLNSIKKQQRGLKLLTGGALGLWLVAMVGSVFLIWAYFIMYLPKEREMASGLNNVERLASTNTASADSWVSDKVIAKQHVVTFSLNRAIGILTVLTAASVVVLSAAMFATIILVIWNRRVTLRQINANLTQISAQLKTLETTRRS